MRYIVALLDTDTDKLAHKLWLEEPKLVPFDGQLAKTLNRERQANPFKKTKTGNTQNKSTTLRRLF